MLTEGGLVSDASGFSKSLSLLACAGGADVSTIGSIARGLYPLEQPAIARTATNAPPHRSHFQVFRIV